MHAISFQTPNSGAPGEIFGIDVAINNFARNYCRYTKQEKILVVPDRTESYETFLALAAEAGVSPDRCIQVQGITAKLLYEAHTLFHPDPYANNYFWQRGTLSPGYAICTLTHSMTGSNAAGVVADYLTIPTQPGDAIICPSFAIRDAIADLIDIHADYINHRFKLTGDNKATCPVDLPVIPLAIETDVYVKCGDKAKRAAQRAALGADEDEFVILSFGRISHYTKAHPLPLFLGAQRAAQQTKRKIRVVCLGFFSPPELEAPYKKLAADICQDVTVDFIDKGDARFPDGLWAGADVFVSLIDNHQESFGLTPIEAMAAGLPSVISNWDGYRDGVRHGIDGIQIPTSAPAPGEGMSLAYQYYNGGLSYGEYLAASAQAVQVDIDATAAAFAFLANNPDKAQQMGAHGQQRATSHYDWKQIIPAYEALWDEQHLKRQHFAKPAFPENWHAYHPAYPDPYAMFKSFPSHVLSLNDRVAIAASSAEIELLLRHKVNHTVPYFTMQLPDIIKLLTWITQNNGATLDAAYHHILATGAKTTRGTFMRTIGWMLKCGFIARIAS